ncbi:hypothetical protein NI17_012225 [Thermobifida halotolerans]|uniref:Uncharacterized protein n=1 Tax=Thermobifida halotolerans TaxID=483545 RepID=A0A399G734_9ACTN|nr:hypothetical protein [Thermobifida halotolerans]UOE17681.1 hypothetical protein NI17_012225 [Thermobifida halotolerans]
MEFLGVPWFVLVRHLGPPLVLLGVGAALVRWRRPARTGLVVAALCVNLLAAALPFLWIAFQAATGLANRSAAGLVMTGLQPLVFFTAWMLLLVAAVARPPTVGHPHR